MTAPVHPLLSASRALVHFFAAEWTQIEGGKWKSAGGRVVSDAVYQKMKKPSGGGAGAKPAKPAKAAAPKAKSAAKKPAGKTGGATATAVKALYDRAATAHPSEIDAAGPVLANMSHGALKEAAKAVGHTPGAKDSREKLAQDLHDRIKDRHGAAVRRKLTKPAAAPARPSAGGPPSDPKKLTIQQAGTALAGKGYAISGGHTDLKSKATTYDLKKPDSSTVKASADEIKALVYGGKEPGGSGGGPKPTPAPSPKGPAKPPPMNAALDAKVKALSILPSPKSAPAAKPGAGFKLDPSKGDSSEADNRAAHAAKKAKGEIKGEYMPDVDYTKPMGAGAAAHMGAFHAGDLKRFGQKAADFLHGALSKLVGGIKGLGRKLTSKRMQVRGRKLARAVLPKAVGLPLAAAGLAAGALTPLAGAVGGSTLGPVGTYVGAGLGTAAGAYGMKLAADAGTGAAKATRLALASSAAAQRKARRTNRDKLFAEVFSDGPPFDPVALMRARLHAICARQGLERPEVHDDHISAALDSAAGAPVKKFSGLAPFRPNLTRQRGAGLLPFA